MSNSARPAVHFLRSPCFLALLVSPIHTFRRRGLPLVDRGQPNLRQVGRDMRVAQNRVVSVDYTLTDDGGQVLDSSDGREPLSYLHGVGGIIPGLERELEGKQAGDEFQAIVAPEDAYGLRDEDLRQAIPRHQFDDIEELELGMQFRVDSNVGPQVITIVEIAEDVVTVDGNHPLAGVNLNFAITVREVREATAEELDHGHAHGPSGQQC